MEEVFDIGRFPGGEVVFTMHSHAHDKGAIFFVGVEVGGITPLHHKVVAAKELGKAVDKGIFGDIAPGKDKGEGGDFALWVFVPVLIIAQFVLDVVSSEGKSCHIKG
ncbi:MAG: hypothetical protein S4CHLAM102_11740 [Chlamydiia bacterium]|nr:hypothetical protein [Chlamydiia bacterium]